MKNSEIQSKLREIIQLTAAFKLSMLVMDGKEFQKRIDKILGEMEELVKNLGEK